MKYIPDRNSPTLGLSYAIYHLVTKMRLTTIQAIRATGCEDLTLEQYELLFVLFHNNGIYQRQISKLLLKDRSNISRMLNILEKKKLILKKSHKENKKIVEIYITELGKQLVYLLTPIKNTCGENFLKNFSEDEMAVLQKLVDKMSQNAEGLYTISI